MALPIVQFVVLLGSLVPDLVVLDSCLNLGFPLSISCSPLSEFGVFVSVSPLSAFPLLVQLGLGRFSYFEL